MSFTADRQTAIAIGQAADDQTPDLSDSDLDTIVNLEPDLLVSSQQAGKLRDDNDSLHQCQGMRKYASSLPRIASTIRGDDFGVRGLKIIQLRSF